MVPFAQGGTNGAGAALEGLQLLSLDALAGVEKDDDLPAQGDGFGQLDLLNHAVVSHLEVVGGQAPQRLAVAMGQDIGRTASARAANVEGGRRAGAWTGSSRDSSATAHTYGLIVVRCPVTWR